MATTEALATGDFDDVLDVWRRINVAVNAIAESVGSPPVYPFEHTGDVVAKLAFVHRQVVALWTETLHARVDSRSALPSMPLSHARSNRI